MKTSAVAVMLLLATLSGLASAMYKNNQHPGGQGPHAQSLRRRNSGNSGPGVSKGHAHEDAPEDQHFGILRSDYVMKELSETGTSLNPQAGDEVTYALLCQSDDDCNAVSERKRGGGRFKRPEDDPELEATPVGRERTFNGIDLSARRMRVKNNRGNSRQFRKRRGGGNAVVIGKFKSGRQLECDFSDCTDILVGDSCGVRCHFVENNGFHCDDCAASVSCQSGDSTVTGVLGADGWVDLSFSPTEQSTATCQGQSSFGDERTLTLTFAPSAPAFSGVAGASMEVTGSPAQVLLTVRLAVLGDEHLHHTGELHATIVDGNGDAVVDVQAMGDYSEDGSISTLVQADWFQGHSGPYSLANVAVKCPDFHNTLASASSVSVDTGSDFHPAAALTHNRLMQMGGRSKESVEERESRMRHGRKPSREERHAWHGQQRLRHLRRQHHLSTRAGGAGFAAEIQAAERDIANKRKDGRKLQNYVGKKILVHGYCAEGNPFPTSQFSNDIAFQDAPGSPTSGYTDPRRKEQGHKHGKHSLMGGSSGLNNWSNDLFARKIDHFAETYNNNNNNGITGCGIIAHSQGGLASLHLYTYYWSCLDDATSGSRMIQSVGSPYQGTALAGNLAALGDIFGVGCDTQYDLTYSGASVWLSNIPSWARSQVNYYTTSFEDVWWRYDYCSLATDLFLNDPEDGVVEKSKGQVSGAINRGHTEGWCHSSGMRDTEQYFDSTRNGQMNAYAQY